MTARRSSPGWALALTSIAFFMVVLDTLVVITALPSMQRDLHAGLSTLEWTVNAYTLAFAAGIITAAALGDRYGRRLVFTLGLVVFTAASAVCGLAPGAGLLIAARAVQGIGAAMVMPLSLTILTSAFPPERRGAIVGIWGGLAGLAVAAGPLVGGAVTQGLDWHWVFWINVPIGVVATVLTFLRLPESHGPATRLDLPAVALAAGGSVSFLWGLVQAGDTGWGSAGTIALLGAGALMLAGFVAWERSAPEPMLPLRLFASLGFSAAITTSALSTAALTAAAFLIGQYFQMVLGLSPFNAGVRLLPWCATPMLVAPIAGALSDRVGQRPLMVVGTLLQAAGFVWVALVASAGAGYAGFVLPLVIAGVGVSMVLPTAPTATLNAAAPRDMGKASGANSTLQRFGGAFGVAVTTAVFTANGHLGQPASFVAGFQPALVVAGCLSALGAVSALGAASRRRAIQPVATEAA